MHQFRKPQQCSALFRIDCTRCVFRDCVSFFFSFKLCGFFSFHGSNSNYSTNEHPAKKKNQKKIVEYKLTRVCTCSSSTYWNMALYSFFLKMSRYSLYGFASAGILPLTYGISSFLHCVYLGYIDGLIHACITILKPRFIILHHVLCNSFVFFLHCVQCWYSS